MTRTGRRRRILVRQKRDNRIVAFLTDKNATPDWNGRILSTEPAHGNWMSNGRMVAVTCRRCGAPSTGPVCADCASLEDPAQDRTVGLSETERGKPRGAPRTIGPYAVLAEISRGGMGIVYKAKDPALDRTVALKVLIAGEHASAEAIERFQREAKAAASLQHPAIAQVYGVGEDQGRRYIVMEFVEGRGLDHYLEEPRLGLRKRVEIVRNAARAVAFAHERGIVHRDLKPSNLLLTVKGSVKIVDFGLARLARDDSRLTHTGIPLGTPAYMSPEQASGRPEEVGPETDIYSLGATLYTLLTRRPPFEGPSAMAVLARVMSESPVSPGRFDPQITAPLEAIVLKAMRKEKKSRYATAAELAEDLQRFLDGREVTARPESLASKLAGRARRHVWPLVAAAALLVAAGAVAVALGRPSNGGPPPPPTPPPASPFDLFKPKLGLSGLPINGPTIQSARRALAELPAPAAAQASSWVIGELRPLSDPGPKSGWISKQGQASRIVQWCTSLELILKECGPLYEEARALASETRRRYEQVAAFRGRISLKILVGPYAELISLRVGDSMAIDNCRLVGEATVRGDNLFTPLVIDNLDIGEYTLTLSHPELGTMTLDVPGAELRNGLTYLLHGTFGEPGSFRLKSP
jgi:serine/threonine protein kinase